MKRTEVAVKEEHEDDGEELGNELDEDEERQVEAEEEEEEEGSEEGEVTDDREQYRDIVRKLDMSEVEVDEPEAEQHDDALARPDTSDEDNGGGGVRDVEKDVVVEEDEQEEEEEEEREEQEQEHEQAEKHEGSRKQESKGSFASLGLDARLVRALRKRRLLVPTLVQQRCIPLALVSSALRHAFTS